MFTEIILIGVGSLIGALVAISLMRKQKQASPIDHYFTELRQSLTQRIDNATRQMDERLRENVQAMNETKSFVTDRVSSSEHNVQRSMREVTNSLGKLDQATAAIHKTSAEIVSFQNMLKNPKVRGGFGEVLLANLMADILPHDRYGLQYKLAGTGEIADAVILLQDNYLVAIDAKFPLANFQIYSAEKNHDQKKALRKAFLRDVKRHIADISKKYISPEHNTLDYAFMYIPVEAIYYETMVHDATGGTLWDFSLQNKVVPVSPNSFLAYLQTVLIGLRGMKIEQQAKEILQALGQVRRDFSQFTQEYIVLGTHLTNAKNKYEETTRRLDKFTNRLDQIEINTDTKQLKKEN